MTVSPRKVYPTKLIQQIFEKKNSAKNHFVIQTAAPPLSITSSSMCAVDKRMGREQAGGIAEASPAATAALALVYTAPHYALPATTCGNAHGAEQGEGGGNRPGGGGAACKLPGSRSMGW